MAEPLIFAFRPWVRRAGLSIVIVAAAATALVVAALAFDPGARYGWLGERAIWAYVALLWLGGLKVWIGTMRPVAELRSAAVVLRPLHNLRERILSWDAIRGTEQMIGGDRLIVYYDTLRGMRFAALNLNLVKGRREFLAQLDARLALAGFIEKTVNRSRYRSRP